LIEGVREIERERGETQSKHLLSSLGETNWCTGNQASETGLKGTKNV